MYAILNAKDTVNKMKTNRKQTKIVNMAGGGRASLSVITEEIEVHEILELLLSGNVSLQLSQTPGLRHEFVVVSGLVPHIMFDQVTNA